MPINSLSNKISTIFTTMFKTVGKQADHKRLTNYIITIHQKESTEEILSELSHCLKNILNYRLFAFVIQQKSNLDIWLDPRTYKESLEKAVIEDFSVKDKAKLNYLNYTFSPEHSENEEQKFNMEDITSYEIKEDDYFARVYILTNKGLLDFHDDEIDMILKTTQTAISRQLGMKKLFDAAAIDPLTMCYNRREFKAQLERNISNTLRHKKELSIFMFDLDHFKKINDTYGHQAGDLVLQKVSSLVKNNIRTADFLARYGGEEFIVILPETNKQKAMELANRIRENVSNTRIKLNTGKEIRVTASFGVASLGEGSSDMNQLIHDADTMMYKAKLNGRNTVMPGLIKVCPSIDSKKTVKN
ncbi:MAG: GGDEF domain-containing protein [Desulfobacterales bacterium]|nr:GGDEF domain-containing protein [Desulfobacterales bacterium]